MSELPKILIVDDKEANLIALESVLKGLEADVVKAFSGDSALRLCLNHTFALAIIDVQMPDMDGYELASLLRQDPRAKQVPIIFVSAVYADDYHKFMGYQSGAVDFITKPFNPDFLLSKARIFLELHKYKEDLLSHHQRLETLILEQQKANDELQREIGERRKVEGQLKDARDLAETASKAKSQFLANMSHEMRTPLNGVMGMVQLAMFSEPNTEVEHYLSLARISGQNLLRIINDILDFSKIEAGKIDIDEAPFDLSLALEEMAALFRPQVEQQGLTLDFAMEGIDGDFFQGDKDRIRQVIVNLVGNSIKFTNQGGIAIKARRIPDAEGGGVELKVSDTGVGIPPDMLEKVFEPFTQVEMSYTKRHQGVGLGLSIVRSLVQRMGGQLRIESAQDRGTTICCTLPLARVASQAEAPPPEVCPVTPNRALNILLVEDEPINRMTAEHFLLRLGHGVTCAGNGKEAVAACTVGDFDLVLMDIQMPVMDGVQATQAIRAHETQAAQPPIPIIAMTAYAMSGDRERFLEAGMDQYLSKPVELETLARVLAEYSPRLG